MKKAEAEAATLCKDQPSPSEENVFSRIGRTYLHLGHPDKALSLLDYPGAPEGTICCAVIEHLCHNGRFDQAAAVVKRIRDRKARDDGMACLAGGLLYRKGDVEGAMKLAAGLSGFRGSSVNRVIISRLLEKGHFERARAQARTLPEFDREDAEVRIAEAERASKSGGEGNPHTRPSFADDRRRRQSAKALVKKGQYEQAATLAATMTDPEDEAGVYVAIAVHAHRQGKKQTYARFMAAALKAVEKEDDWNHRADYLDDIAKAQLGVGDLGNAWVTTQRAITAAMNCDLDLYRSTNTHDLVRLCLQLDQVGVASKLTQSAPAKNRSDLTRVWVQYRAKRDRKDKAVPPGIDDYLKACHTAEQRIEGYLIIAESLGKKSSP